MCRCGRALWIVLLGSVALTITTSAGRTASVLTAEVMGVIDGGCTGTTYYCYITPCGPPSEACKQAEGGVCNPNDPETACNNHQGVAVLVNWCGFTTPPPVNPDKYKCKKGNMTACQGASYSECYCRYIIGYTCKTRNPVTGYNYYPCLAP